MNFIGEMLTFKDCDFMGFTNVIFFIKCKNDPGFPEGNIVLTSNPRFCVHIITKPEYDLQKNNYKVHFVLTKNE
jgi:hypothetical protein